MAQDIYMEVDGMESESTAANTKKGLEILSFSHGVSQPASATVSGAGGRTVEKANHGDFTVTKYIDVTSPTLNLWCCEGRHIKAIKVKMFRADKEGKPVEYMNYIFDDSIISSISVGGGAGDLPIETVTINYGNIQWKYIQQKVEGSEAGNLPTGWSRKENKAL